MCTAGPSLPQTLEFYLPVGCKNLDYLKRLPPLRGTREETGKGDVRGAHPSPHSPPQAALQPEMSLFTARTQDFLLLEKRAFYRA